ncbi:MAG: pilus assembly protein PilM [Candidatus Omnitrophica bacterium]|nr:pilus assembly protein PilM [Candidatus Omnitrophota bacterium]MBU4149302.1 pilus assembly protein PilM [Candidatus Omnitrophota bacterium]
MRRFNKTAIGLDIGSRFIKLVELKSSGGNIILNKFGIKEIPKDLKLDRDKVTFQLIAQLLAENNIKERNVNICAAGQSVFVRFVKLLQVKEDKLKQTMRFEAQNQIPFPLNEVAWDWSLLDTGENTTKKAIIAAIKKNIVDDMISKLSGIRLSTRLIDISLFSLYNCMVFNEDFSQEGLGAVMDIGMKATNLVIFKKGNIWIRSFPIAAERIEEAKDQGMDELIGELERSVEYYFIQGGEELKGEKKLDELILTGGGSVIDGLESRIAERLNIKPKALDPFRKLRVSKEIFSSLQEKGAKNQLSIAVGLALRGLVPLEVEINFLKETICESYTSRQKNIHTRLSIVMAVLLVISFSIFMRQDYTVKRAKLDRIDKMLDLYNTYEPKIKELQGKEDILKEKIDILCQAQGSRAIWLSVFKTISEILPKEVWVTDISGIVSLEKNGLGRLDLGGEALSYQAVNNFVSSLKSAPEFKDVKPISSSIEKDENTGEEIVRFSITMDVVTIES